MTAWGSEGLTAKLLYELYRGDAGLHCAHFAQSSRRSLDLMKL